ncbi:uncharacterized protein LOC125757050 [Rhipicephalus sanguineus]|uniref:uncharacterized protein LOC125757050 n=1 Tax=Rhipicephalus sanguineus TaxID=34632 RepID=UPI0020C4FB2E|nr:uncharacterized protein LOC125757050 [Rhipicephalus sanguineus]
MPETVVSDNGPQLVSEEFTAFMRDVGARHIVSAPYHPSTNGLAERFVQTLKSALRKSPPASAQQRRRQQLSVIVELEALEADLESAWRRSRQLLLAAAARYSSERSVWAYPREVSWYETTLPHVPDNVFKENFRVNRATFDYIVSVCESMRRLDTNMRKAIPLKKRVAIALYRLTTSAEDGSVGNIFGVGRSTVNLVFREFCATVVRRLESRYVKFPREREVAEHVRRFAAVTGFPQGMGALDGCHIEVCPPKENAADYINYKGWYSVILLAVVDHTYKFQYTNVGTPGKNHDSNVFQRSRLPKVLAGSRFTKDKRLLKNVEIGPVLLADQAFPLQPTIMKPYPHPGPRGSPTQYFNYRLSSARRVVENAFGRLKARFRILHTLECDIDNVNSIIRACCVLHNICEQLNDRCDVLWVDAVTNEDRRRPQPVCTTRRVEPSCVAVRNALAEHLHSTK